MSSYLLSVVHVNRYNRLGVKDSDSERFNIEKKIMHPHYDHRKYRNDFLILKLDGMAETKPVRLNSNPHIPAVGNSLELTLLGWGDMDASEEVLVSAYVLQHVDVSAISNEQCEFVYPGYIVPSTLCAMEPNKDGCQGDSGGPLLVRGRRPEQDIQVGVISWYVLIQSVHQLI